MRTRGTTKTKPELPLPSKTIHHVPEHGLVGLVPADSAKPSPHGHQHLVAPLVPPPGKWKLRSPPRTRQHAPAEALPFRDVELAHRGCAATLPVRLVERSN